MEYMKWSGTVRLLPCTEDFITCIGVAGSHSWATGCAENVQGGVLQTASDGCDVTVGHNRRQQRHEFVFIVFVLSEEHKNTKIMHSL